MLLAGRLLQAAFGAVVDVPTLIGASATSDDALVGARWRLWQRWHAAQSSGRGYAAAAAIAKQLG